MNYGYSTRLTYNKQRVKSDGTATVYIQIIYDRKKKTLNMRLSWPVDRIDEDEQVLLPRKRNDTECNDYNLIIKRDLGKINEVFRMARIADKKLSMAQVINEYENFASKDDFISFMETAIDNRLKEGIIRASTAKTQKSALATFRLFRAAVQFSEINKILLEKYKAFMYNKMGYDSDTAHTKLKNIRTYMNLALKDGYVFSYPFDNFKMPKQEGRIDFVDEEEVIKLRDFFYSGRLTPGTNKKKALRAFLFICYTGVRVGDIYKLRHRDIKNGVLEFIPNKNTSDNQEMVRIPLHEEAKKLIETKSGMLLVLPPETKLREHLHAISKHLKLKSKVTPHIGRHTFATRFLRAGGKLEVLQKLLGHAKITTTMIYVHVSEARKREEIDLLG